MIRKIKFDNFYSFKGRQEISFVAHRKDTYDYYSSINKDQITKVAGFIGGNASGKTNIMKLFSFLGYFIGRTIKNNPDQISSLAYKRYFNNNLQSNFSVEFERNNKIYFYEFTLNNDTILKEQLDEKMKQGSSTKIHIYKRILNELTVFNHKYFSNITTDIFKNIRSDVSIITFLKRSVYNVDVINDIYDYFWSFSTNINERGEINNFNHQLNTLDIYIQDKQIKKEMEDFVKHFDLGLSGFDIKEKDTDDNKIEISVEGIHKIGSSKKKIDFSYESRGTKNLFFTMAKILKALKNEEVIIIDEIEMGFHPDALSKLIQYFIDNDVDKRSQLIFSSHSLGFMNKLDMHQIYLVNKNNNCESKVTRLNEIEGIRPDENHLAKYMSGAYGAFPKIRI